MTLEKQTIDAALAGLLHDVGKLEQRSRDDPWRPPEGFEEEGQPVHAQWSMAFIEANVPQRYRAAAMHGAYHHRPDRSPSADKSLSNLVALADKLSSGERSDQPDDQKKKDLPRQMVSVFDRISLQKSGKQLDWHYLPLKPLRLQEEVLFPLDQSCNGREGARAYEAICARLRSAVSRSCEDPETYLEHVLAALQETTWCVPSAYYHSLPDVSLYDHSRMTSALSVCLSGWSNEKVHRMLEAVTQAFRKQATKADEQTLKEPVALLVGGDLSGIQDFIYTLSSTSAARTLRGRSFYVELLTEAVMRFVLREARVPATNVIYSGGGHFFLLLPLGARDKLPSIKRAITERLLHHHGTDLYLALGWTEVPAKGFQRGEFAEHWNAMHLALGHAKLTRYSELEEAMFERVLAVPVHGGNPDQTCSICGAEDRPVVSFVDDDEAQSRICSMCKSFADQIGGPLPRARYVALGFGSPGSNEIGTACDVLEAFGLEQHFLDSSSDKPGFSRAERAVIWAFDDTESEKVPNAGPLPSVIRTRYVVNRVPAMTFDALQKKVRSGFERLGVLRMDVDDLGEVFSRGLGKGGEASRATLARLATLSFQISLFFDGWVKRLVEKEGREGLIYTVYSGGDDVFLIGPWDQMPELAMDVAHDFQRFVSGNPDLHLSGGMAFIGGKYPVYQAAEDAGEALDNAKGMQGKNAFSYLQRPWKWADFRELMAKKNEVLGLVEADSGSGRSILQILQQLAHNAEDAAADREKPIWGPWMWQGAYMLTRMAERSRDASMKERILALRDRLDENEYSNLSQWGVAARWAQLEVRKKADQ